MKIHLSPDEVEMALTFWLVEKKGWADDETWFGYDWEGFDIENEDSSVKVTFTLDWEEECPYL